ncbi:hypothetical protein COOONC_24930 [Cooperia oncophora]
MSDGKHLCFSGACVESDEEKMSTNGYGHGMARAASHAGSWYSSNPKELDRQISRWLDAAGDRVGIARAIVSPYVLHFLYHSVTTLCMTGEM